VVSVTDPYGRILNFLDRSRYVNDVNNICFYLHSQLLYFLIILFSLHVSASMGHPQVST
jgi:hypothetical protein